MKQLRLWFGCVAALVGTMRHARAEVDLAQIEDIEVLSLNDLLDAPVTSASRYAQKPSGSPTLVSTLDADLISRLGYRSVGDALRVGRGVYTSSDRNYSYLGARGFSTPGDYNTRFALSINNHAVNDPVYGQAPTGAELGLPMIAVDRIELIRGGAWSVHGQSALLGAVQVITATGASRPGIRATTTTRATAESFSDPANRAPMAPRGQDVEASYGLARDGYDLFVAGSYAYDPGMPALYMPELASDDRSCVDRFRARRSCDGVVRGGDAEESGGLFAAFSKGDLAVRVLGSRRRKRAPTAAFGTTVGDSIETFDDRAFGEVEYTRERTASDLVARVTADYYGYTGTYPWAEGGFNDDRASAAWFGGELRGRLKRATYGRYLRDLEAGAGVALAKARATQLSFDVGDDEPVYYIDRTDRTRNAAVFGHASARAFDHIVGFAAFRSDYHPDTFGLVTNPQVGLVLDGGSIGRVRASMSRGYRAPNVYERYYGASDEGIEPPDLSPERSETRELSLERYLGDNVRALVVAFQQDVHDLLGLADEGSLVYSNQGTVRSRGIEAEVEGRWDRVRLRATYTRQRATNEQGLTPANSPASLANLVLVVPVAGGRGDVGVESWYVNERTAFNGGVVPPQFLTNVVVTVHDVVDALDLSFGVNNLFDQRGGSPGSQEHRQTLIPHDPRVIWFRLGVALP